LNKRRLCNMFEIEMQWNISNKVVESKIQKIKRIENIYWIEIIEAFHDYFIW
jgi:hypothetical protein